MIDFAAPLPQANPLEVEQRFEFVGWHELIAAEINQILGDRDPEWLNAIAQQIGAALRREQTAISGEDLESLPSLARSAANHAVHPDDVPGQIHAFAALEPRCRWAGKKHPHFSQRWERYAVFALWTLHHASTHLPRKVDGHGSDPLTSLMQVDLGASLTIEAMRALQIGQSLLFEQKLLSQRNTIAADTRHEPGRAHIEQARRIAREGDFKTNEQAAWEIQKRVLKSDKSEYAFTTILGWLST